MLVCRMIVSVRFEVAEAIEERCAIEPEAIGCDKNHVHVFCSAHPKMAPGGIVQIFKNNTAREVFRRKPWVKKELWGGEFWADGYYLGSVGEHATWDTVEQSVGKESHDKKIKQV